MLHGEQGRPGPGRDPRLGVDVLDVAADRLGRDAERDRHLLVGVAPGDQAQHLDLAVGEARRSWLRGRARRLTAAASTASTSSRPKRPASASAPQLRAAAAGVERRPVRAVLGHGVVGVGGGEQPGGEVELSAPAPRW